jgi:hypothetical protein
MITLFLHEAIRELYPNANLIHGDDVDSVIVKENDDVIIEIDNELVIQKASELNDQHLNLSYQRKRSEEYPSFADQFDLLYHGGYDAWKDSIQAVKDKYPKPE